MFMTKRMQIMYSARVDDDSNPCFAHPAQRKYDKNVCSIIILVAEDSRECEDEVYLRGVVTSYSITFFFCFFKV